MAEAPPSFDSIIQEGRKKRKAEQLAAEIFSKNRRSSAPPTTPKPGLGGSLASRVGVAKRPSSLTRSTTTPRPSTRPSHLSRPPVADPRPRPSYTNALTDAKPTNGSFVVDPTPASTGISFKGAASGPYTVIAQNFAPGTTAADIESVMQSVGGDMNGCKLVASQPTVIAEMAFLDRSGAEKVIETFNGKKADGRTLYVFWKTGAGPGRGGSTSTQASRNMSQQEPPALVGAAVPAAASDDVVMDVDMDANAESRQAQDRLREERRGRERDDRDRDRVSKEVFPTGPSGPRGPRGGEPGYHRGRDRHYEYEDRRYGYDDRGGWRDGPVRGGYYGRGGRESMMGRGRSWRP